MLTIKVNNTALELPDNFVYDWEENSPLFGFDGIKGSESISSTVSAKSKVNRTVFGNPHEIHKLNKTQREFPCVIEIGTDHFKTGVLEIMDANTEQYKFRIKTGASVLDSVKKESIQSVNIGEVRLAPDDYEKTSFIVGFGLGSTDYWDLVQRGVYTRTIPTSTTPITQTIDAPVFELIYQNPEELYPSVLDNSLPLNRTDEFQRIISITDNNFTTRGGVKEVLKYFTSEINKQTYVTGISAQFIDGGTDIPPGTINGGQTRWQIANHTIRLHGCKETPVLNQLHFTWTGGGDFDQYRDYSIESLTSVVLGEDMVDFVKEVFATPHEILSFPSSFQIDPELATAGSYYTIKARINEYIDDSGLVVANTTFTDKYYIVPHLNLLETVKRVFEYFGYKTSGKIFGLSDYQKLVIFSNRPLNFPVEDENGDPYSAYDHVIKFAKHLPDMKFNEFVNAVRLTFGQAFYLNEKTKEAEFHFLDDVLDNPEYDDWTEKCNKHYSLEPNQEDGFTFQFYLEADNWTSYFTQSLDVARIGPEVANYAALPTTNVERGEIRLVANEQKYYYAFKVEGIIYWRLLGTKYQNYIKNNGTREIKLNSAPLDFRSRPEGFIKDKVLIPYSSSVFDIELSNPFDGRSKSDKVLRLMLLQGQKVGNGKTFIYAASESIYREEIIPSEISMSWNSANGLQKNLNKWYRFLNNCDTIYRTAYLNVKDLKDFDILKPKRVQGAKLFIEKIRLPISKNGIGKAEITFRKVNW